MSELKARHVVDVYDDYAEHPCEERSQVYLKSEADEVIAELEERIADGDKDFEIANHQNERLLKIVRHHKYKRCLAMAYVEWLKQIILYNYPQSFIYRRAASRKRKWLELAEKFKPNT